MAANGREIHACIGGCDDNDRAFKPLVRQMAICSMSWMSYMTAGIACGTPTVMLPQIRKNLNSTITVSENMEALLKSLFGYAGIPWIVFMTYLTIVTGRRIPLVFASITMISGSTLLYCSNSVTHIMISEILQSCCTGSINCISVIFISEYAAPKYRGVFLTMKSATFYWGIWIANAIGTFFPWESIPLLGIACSLMILPVMLFPESPSWLASKGRFEECRKSHRWLRGIDKDSEQELEKLIKSQEVYLSTRDSETRNLKVWSMLKSKEFYKPVLLTIVICFMYHCSGKLVCVMYSIDIIKKITNREETAYIGMLILDGVSILGMYTGSAVSKYVSRRTMLFTSSSISIFFLFMLSFYLYLIKLTVIGENKYISVTLLALFSVSTSSGIILMATSLFGELVSLKYRSVSMLITSVNFFLLYSLILQPAPYIFKYFGLHGAFFFYGVSSSIFTAICYKYLPETKDKTLLEIEEYFKDVNHEDVQETLLPDPKIHKEIDK